MPPTPVARNLVLLDASTVVSVGPVSWGVEDMWVDSCLWLGDLGADLQVQHLGGRFTTNHDFWDRPKATVSLWGSNHCPKRPLV